MQAGMWGQDSLRPSQSHSDFGELASWLVRVYNAASMLPDDQSLKRQAASDAARDFLLYETITFDSRLEIGEEGRIAHFLRRQRVRFLEDDVTIFLDRVWGDGVLFASYDTGSTRIIDAFPTRRGELVVLLGLPRPFRKGETFEVVTERKIFGAFTDQNAYWELTMSAPTQTLSLDVSDRGSRGTNAVYVAAPRLRGLDVVRHGKHSLRLKVDSPSLYVPYRLEWRWN